MNKFNTPENKTIPELEDEITSFWKEKKIFEKSIDSRSEDNLYVFYDGPPFISGLPHYGHLLGSIAKDVIPRYFTMKGKRVERVWGWDAHGLTVENKVQKKLNIKNRRDIESFGLEEFTKACYEYTSEISAEWEWYVDKIGRWVDFKNAYKTTDQKYMESVMWAFKELYDKGLIYEGIRTSLYCPTCGTPVSNFEIAMDNSYREKEDPAITIKFKIKTPGKFKDMYILAWTTTPWTLPSNRALVVDDKSDYVLVELENNQGSENKDNEKYIVAKKRLKAVFDNVNENNYKVIDEFKGESLLELTYEPLYSFYKAKENEFKIYAYEGMVNMEDGTGIVHSAPGFGEIDTEMGKFFDLTIMQTIDDEGSFIPGNNTNNPKENKSIESNPFEGMYFLKANKLILEDLIKRNLLFKNETISHRIPFHDRCDTDLMYRAQNSWFINIAEIKNDLFENNKDINWIPDHFKFGRFYQGIEQAPDWCISRNRFWATPMPVWEADDGDRIIISSISELEELSGKKVKDLHRPYIDEIIIEKEGKVYKRRPEVLDSWMEAGSMPYAQIHYPFENKEKFERNFPGDYIVEYDAQVRAWFYVMHVLSTALFKSNSFKNVIVTGTLMGSDGRKMSKTFGNYTDPKEVLNKYGGDAVRLYLMGSPLMMAESANFDEVELRTKLRNVVNPLWNSAKFLLTYAKSNNWVVGNYEASDNILDRWIIARLNETIKGLSTNIEDYLVPPAVRLIEEFVDDLSRWYVRRSRDRISSGDLKALSTLHYVLVEFSKAAAPLIPFITEKIYQHLVVDIADINENVPESIHLCDYPKFDEKIIEESKTILKNMKEDRDTVSIFLSQRSEKNIPVRQTLNSITTKATVHYRDIVKDELNIHEIFDQKDNDELDTTITEDLRLEGMVRDMIRKLQDLRKEQGLSVSDKVNVVIEDTKDNREVIEKYKEDIKKKVIIEDLKFGDIYSVSRV